MNQEVKARQKSHDPVGVAMPTCLRNGVLSDQEPLRVAANPLTEVPCHGAAPRRRSTQ